MATTAAASTGRLTQQQQQQAMTMSGPKQKQVNGPRPGVVALFQAGGMVDDSTSRSTGRSRGGWGTGSTPKQQQQGSGNGKKGGSKQQAGGASTGSRRSGSISTKPSMAIAPRVLSETQLAMVKQAREAREQQGGGLLEAVD